jgi:hypothetical protein
MSLDTREPVRSAEGREELRELIASVVRNGEDSEAMVGTLVQAMLDQPELMQRNLPEILHYWARAQVQALRSHIKAHIQRAANGQEQAMAHRSAVGIAIAAEYSRMADMPLYGGKPIGKATAAEIRSSAGRYASQAGDMARKARWQLRVADEIVRTSNREDATAGRVLSEEILKRLWVEAGSVEPMLVPVTGPARERRAADPFVPRRERKAADPELAPRDRRRFISGRRGRTET